MSPLMAPRTLSIACSSKGSNYTLDGGGHKRRRRIEGTGPKKKARTMPNRSVPNDPLRRALAEVARAGGFVTYRDLATRIAMAGPHRIHRLTPALEDLLRADHAAEIKAVWASWGGGKD